jgi:hypothetical protein
MVVILAAFFFGMITLGFTLLTVMPLFLVWLMVGVYLEPEQRSVTVEETPPANSASAATAAAQEALAPDNHLVGAGR